ncbi:MAG TPA: PAS domain S-box protein [Chitinophagaceae bacterium]|nr:PAS domain S-box protein [Chitinophagaceae bacterium]
MISYAQNIVEFFKRSSQFYYTVTDLEGRYRYVNPLFSKKFSYLHSDFTNIPVINIVYADDLELYQQAASDCIRCAGKPVAVEVRHPSSNGHLYRSRLELTALPDETGAPAYIQCIGTDISEEGVETSDRAPDSSEQSEILQNVVEAIFKLDLEGNIVYMTPEFTRLTGYNTSDVFAKHWGQFIHPDDLDICYDAMAKVVLQRLVMRNICFRFRQKDNSYLWYSTSASLITNKAGEPVSIICVSRDITERKYVEDALHASEERYRVFIGQSSEAIWRYELSMPVPVTLDEEAIIDHIRQHGFLAECNDNMAAMHGYDVSSELIGSRLDELLDFNNPRNIEFLRSFIRNGYRLSDAESLEFDQQGNPRYFVNNLVGIVEDGYLKRAWGTQRDITEKKLISERNRYLANLTENVYDAILGGDLEMNIMSCNPAAEKLYGFSAQELIGHKIQDFVTLQYHNTSRDAILKQLFEKGTWIGEASFIRPRDQKHISFLSTISVIKDTNGKPTGFVAINKDITDTKLALEKVTYLAKLVENTTDVLTSADLEFRVVTWNKAAEKVYGITAEQVIGKNIRDFMVLHYQDSSREEVRRILLETGEWRGEMYFTRPTDGKHITLLMNFATQRDDAGNPSGYIIGGTDITERKEAELRIKESEERFRLVADSAPVMMWMCDTDNRTNYVNKPWQRFTGHTAEEMLGRGWSSVVHPEDVQKSTQEFDECFLKREPVRLVYRLRRTDNTYRWVLDIGVPRLLDDGTFLGYIGSVIDIHDQKLKEDQLRYQANILENVSDGVVITDLEFKVLSWNSVAEELFGIAPSQAIGEKLTRLVEFDYGALTFKDVLEEFDRKGRWKGEVSFINRKGEKKYLLNTVSLISDEEGHSVSVMIVGSDISELKKAEEQLQQSELFYRNLIGNSLDGILLTNREGNITFSAPSLKNILGYESEDVIGKNIFAFVHPDDIALAFDRFHGKLLDGGNPEYVVIRLLKSNNEWLWCMVRGHNLLDNPQVGSFVVYLHDDSLRKKAEDELIESERRLRTAQQIAGLGYMEVEPHGKLYCSAEMQQVMAIPEEEMPADLPSFLGMIHPADRKKVRDDVEAAFDSGTSFENEFRIEPDELREKIIQSIGWMVHEPESGKSILKITIQDVTNIRSAQLALRTSESRFRSLFEHSLDGILLTQPGGAVKSANPAICQMLGYTREEILEQKRRDIFDFNDPQFSRIVETKDENGRFKGELALVHKSGRKIPCEISSVLFRDSEGRAYHSTIIRDITRQKEAELQLKKREAVLSGIAEATNNLIIEEELDTSINYSIELIGKIVGADRVYIFANHADEDGRQFTSQRYEWCAENIIPQADKPSSVNVPFADFMDVLQQLSDNKPFTAFVNQVENEKLKKRWQAQHNVSMLILPIFMQGRLWGFVGFDECHYERVWQNWEIDILKVFGSSLAGAIERKKAEHELSRTNERLNIAIEDLNKIMDYSQDVICSFDDKGRFMQVSAASLRIWGYHPREVIGRNIREFILPEDIINTAALIDRMKAGESVSTNFENHFKRKDGSLVTLDWSAYWYEKERIAFCVARDITLQKEIEQQLIASETRFRSFMDNSPAAAWICDEEGRYVYLNKFLATHVLPEGFNSIGKTLFELYPAEFANLYHSNNLQVLKQNGPLEAVEKGIRGDGTPVMFLVYKFPVLIGPGQRGIGGVAIDITDKMKAEEALRTSEQNLKAIFSSTRDAFFLVDKNLKLISYNPIAAELYALYTEGGHIDDCEDLLQLLPPERQVVLKKHVENALKGHPLEYEVQYDFGGQPIWFNMVMQPVIGAKGEVDAVCATITNITSKKIAEQKIKETAEQLTNIMETISDGMFILDKDLVVQYMNKAAEKLLRVDRKEVAGTGKDLKVLGNIVKMDPASFVHYYKKALRDQKALHFEKYFEAMQTWFEIDAYPVGDGLTIYFRDITARKRQEMTLSLEKKVLEMNAMPQSSLASTVSAFLKGLEYIYQGMICSVMLQENQTIKPLAAPSIPPEYNKEVDGLPIGPNMGSCGTAMFLKKPVYVSDIATDPLWEHGKKTALQFNLRACWSIPIINAHDEVLASFAIYYNEPKEPLEYERKAIDRAADILRVIIENKQAEEHIRVTNQRYHFVTKATNEAIWDLDLVTNKMYWAEGYYILFGYDPSSASGSLEQSHQRIHPQDLKRIKASLQNFLRRKTKTRWEDEYRYRKADGTYAYVVDKAFLIADNEGRPKRMIGSMQDITSRKELEQRLIEQEIGKQKMLTQATIDGQEKERKEIGKELHDNINQILSTTKLYLDLAQHSAEGSTAEMIGVSSKSIMEAINEIRKLSRSLVPPTLGDLGLIESIKDLCEAFTNMQTFNIEFTHRNIKEKQLADNQKLMLFRIIQEQTNNIVKHAKARNVKITLKAARGWLTLEITDDGKGFDSTKTKKGVGLNNIISRAELFNGSVEIITAPGNGCKVKVTIPVKY